MTPDELAGAFRTARRINTIVRRRPAGEVRVALSMILAGDLVGVIADDRDKWWDVFRKCTDSFAADYAQCAEELES